MCAVLTIRGLTACLGLTFGLSGAVSSVAVAQQALPREDLLALEQALAQLNFDPGKIDGTVDDRTRAAVRLYQEFAALEPDGEITQSLIAEIRSVAESFKDLRGTPNPAESASAAPNPSPASPEPTSRAQAPAPEPAPEAAPNPVPVQEPKPAIAAAPEPKPAAPGPEPAPPAQAAAPAPSEAPAQPPAQAQETPPPKPEPKSDAQTAIAEPAKTKAPPEAQPPAANPPAEPKAEAPVQAPKAASTPPTEAPGKPSEAGYDVGGLLSRLKSGGETATPAAQPDGLGTGQVAPLPDQGTGSRAPSVAAFSGAGYGELRAGYLAAQSGDLERAVRLYTEALDSRKLTLDHAAGAHYNRANAFFYLGDFDKAIDDYAAAIGNKPGFANAYYNRGFAFQAKGDKRQAVEDFHRARDLGLQRLGVRAPDMPPPLQ